MIFEFMSLKTKTEKEIQLFDTFGTTIDSTTRREHNKKGPGSAITEDIQNKTELSNCWFTIICQVIC